MSDRTTLQKKKNRRQRGGGEVQRGAVVVVVVVEGWRFMPSLLALSHAFTRRGRAACKREKAGGE